MHYCESRQDETGALVPTTPRERLILLAKDLDDATLPDDFPTTAQLYAHIRVLQIVSGNIRRLRIKIEEGQREWERRRQRLRMSVASSDKLGYSDSGIKRREMRDLCSATWGPTSSSGMTLGIKESLSPVERETALQLANLLAPDIDHEAIPRVQHSFDDLYQMPTRDMDTLEALESQLKNKHFDLNNLTTLVEIESYEARRAKSAKE